MIPEAICEPSSVRPASPSTKPTTLIIEPKSHKRTTETPDQKNSKLDTLQTTSNLDADSPKRLEIVDYDEDGDDHDDGLEVEHDDNNRTNNLDGRDRPSNQPQDPNENSISNNNNNHNLMEQSYQRSENTIETVSHKLELDSVGVEGLSPVKKIKEDKKRFQEVIIEGFAIRAFKTWEDLQDEVQESEILMEKAKKAQQSDIKKPNPSSSKGSTSLSSRTKTTLKSRSTAGAAKSGGSRSHQSKQSSPSKGANSSKVNFKPKTNSDAQSENTKSQKPTNSGAATNLKDGDSGKTAYTNGNQQIEQNQQHPRQGGQHQTRQLNHEISSYPANGYHSYAPQSNSNPLPGAEVQHQFNPTVNSNHFYVSDPNHNHHRLTGPNYANPRGLSEAHFDPSRSAQTYQYATIYNSSRAGPQQPPQAPSYQNQTPGSQAAQQYFPQYHQYYRQMQYPTHQTYPALQNPYYASINPPPSSAPPKESIGHPPIVRPQPPFPPTSMPMPSSSSLAPPYNTHPYTVTDTIISRQTSIVPPPPLHPSGMDYISNGGYGYRYPQYPLQNHVIPHSFNQYPPPPSGYMPPAGRVRSFMGYEGSYANFSNVPSGYANYMNYTSIPKSSNGPPDTGSYYGPFNRVTTNSLHQTSTPNLGARGLNPYMDFRPPSGPPSITSFPPQ